jgi:hypothetical protein
MCQLWGGAMHLAVVAPMQLSSPPISNTFVKMSLICPTQAAAERANEPRGQSRAAAPISISCVQVTTYTKSRQGRREPAAMPFLSLS